MFSRLFFFFNHSKYDVRLINTNSMSLIVYKLNSLNDSIAIKGLSRRE